MKIIVVGAGILGASVAYHLAQHPGVDVILMEAGPKPASGVTALAFGWVNLFYSDPTDSVSYELRRKAFTYHHALLRDQPVLFGDIRLGSLIWRNSADETEAVVLQQQQAGTAVELIDRKKLGQLEPHLARLPDVAAYVPDDIALNPIAFTSALAKAAASQGASLLFDQTVIDLVTANGRVTGVRTATASYAADAVVIAGGQGTAELVHAFVPDLGLSTSPTILFNFAAERQAIGRIVCCPNIEVRQIADGTVLAAKGYIDDRPENVPDVFGERLKTSIEMYFPKLGPLKLRSANVGRRPMLKSGMPYIGPVAALDGLHIAVGHPGVILAPLAGKIMTEILLSGH
ncbi:FAD-dependent oxidoreductase [Rhizobium sp. FY34]|uniref:NAD(P)/FAD-dependent oxidoreductase n=1 Tax=Rhizobium sp. FY34 TaxID=2562309 RepID=UPI0010C0D2DB|nr:FAD-dependent oxidoreductase [Rhizobium sp. FY34]